MSKQGENIYWRKDGRWEGRYRIGLKPNGNARYVSVYGNSYDCVRKKMQNIKGSKDYKSIDQNKFYGTVDNWMNCWLECVKNRVRQQSYDVYRGNVRGHIVKKLGNVYLCKLNTEDVQGFVDGLMELGIKATTICNIFRNLKAAMKMAVEEGVIEKNPCEGVITPKKKSDGDSVISLKNQQVLEDVAKEDEKGAAVVIALNTGLRIGEISALKWEDVDLDERVICVNKTMQRIGDYSEDDNGPKTKIVFGSPKSAKSYRKIPIGDGLFEYLVSCKEKAKGEYVVSCRNGGYAEPRLIRYWFKKMLKKAGLKDMRFHALRHNFAVRCMEALVDVTTLSKLMGHSSVKMTLDIYTDSLMEHCRDAMRKVDLYIGRSA